MSNSKEYDKLFYPGSNVLKNKFQIKNAMELKIKEEKSVASRILKMDNPNVRTMFGTEFDIQHLLAIHKYLFQDVYSWAGTLKVDSLYKGQDILDGKSVAYCPREYLEENLNSVFSKMKKFDWHNTPAKEKVLKFADLYQELWQCHPFNEGNTRTTSIFMKQFASENNIPVNFKKLFQDPCGLRNSFVVFATGYNDKIMNDLFLDSMVSSKDKIDLRNLTKKVMAFSRDKIKKEEIINQTFDFKDKEYLIKDIQQVQGHHMANAVIQDCDSQKLYFEKNFAGSNPFELKLNNQIEASSLEQKKNMTKTNEMIK